MFSVEKCSTSNEINLNTQKNNGYVQPRLAARCASKLALASTVSVADAVMGMLSAWSVITYKV